MNIGPWQIILIVAVIILLFGAKRIPELARALGRASNEFKKAKAGLETESRNLVADARPGAEPLTAVAAEPEKKKKKKKKKQKAAKKAAETELPPDQA